jgi:RNA polymerase sigma-70 factor, ECF subfamily
MSTVVTDESLLQRARQGDREAFCDWVLRHRRAVLAVAYRMSGDAGLADDVAQTVFIRAWTQLPQLRVVEAGKGWLYRLAVNATIDQLRRERPPLPLSPEAADCTAGPEGQTLAGERAVAVQRAVLALPEQCRAALILREFEGLSYQEIAQALAIPVGTVMSRLHYGRSLLRAALAPYRTPADSAEES